MSEIIDDTQVHVITDAPEAPSNDEKRSKIKKYVAIGAASAAALVGVLWVKSRVSKNDDLDGFVTDETDESTESDDTV